MVYKGNTTLKGDIMRGTIVKYLQDTGVGYILGEDGNTYLLGFDSISESTNHANLRQGLIVDFSPHIEEERFHTIAKDVKVVYKTNPFCADIEQVIAYIRDNIQDSEERVYRIRQLKAISMYISDIDKHPNNAIKLKYISRV